MKWFMNNRADHGQKSMIMWCKREYHEAFDRWKVDCYRHPDQPARISADVARMKSFEAILYYLTADPQWLEQ